MLDAIARTTDDVTVIGVDGRGRFDARAVADAVRPDTALVSVQLANHEVGTLQPAAEIIELVRSGTGNGAGAVVHVDACAAAGHVPVDFGVLGADLCSITGHTFGGPKGASALLVRRGLRFPPFVVGGAQERARRAGIENVPAIVGFGAACCRDRGRRGAAGTRRCPSASRPERSNASMASSATAIPSACLPHLVCLGIEGVEAEPILLALDQRGVAVHSGSSCSSETLEPSPVLAAMGVDADRSLRASVGWSSTDADVDAFLDALPVVVGLLRSLRN